MSTRALLILGLLAVVPFPSSAQEEDTEPPAVVYVSARSSHANPAFAREGASITITVEADERIASTTVTLNDRPVLMEAGDDTGLVYVGTYVVQADDSEGQVAIAISLADLAGNQASASGTTDGSIVTIDLTPPSFAPEMLPDITVEAEHPDGTLVAYGSPESEDDYQVVCEPSEEARFPLGATTVSCQAEDGAGNRSEAVPFRIVHVVDTTPPAITLRGSATTTLTVGVSYVDPGFEVTDNGSSSIATTTESTVDTSVAGTYTITYTATDEAGNTASIVRTVTVVNPPSTGGGGGRRSSTGGGSVQAAGEVNAPGEVLGAAAYQFTRYLREGDTGEEVLELQYLLARLGYFFVQPTGYFGPATRASLMAYQNAHGLEPVGYIGPRTLALLNMGTVATDPRVAELLAKIAELRAQITLLKGVQ